MSSPSASSSASPEPAEAKARPAGGASPASTAEEPRAGDDESAGGDGAAREGSTGPANEQQPPLPYEPIPQQQQQPQEPQQQQQQQHDGPPLPEEAAPDDGWECRWEPNTQAWFFTNRFTGVSQWENPRVPEATAATAAAPGSTSQAAGDNRPAAGGYNPAIHGDYDPNAWYAQVYNQEQEEQEAAAAAPALADASAEYGATVGFNRFSHQFQAADMGPGRHSDEAKARRQMNAFFDVDAAANAHDGRSLKAERQNQKLSKSELKAYKEKRRAKKEEKRRAWLMD